MKILYTQDSLSANLKETCTAASCILMESCDDVHDINCVYVYKIRETGVNKFFSQHDEKC